MCVVIRELERFSFGRRGLIVFNIISAFWGGEEYNQNSLRVRFSGALSQE